MKGRGGVVNRVSTDLFRRGKCGGCKKVQKFGFLTFEVMLTTSELENGDRMWVCIYGVDKNRTSVT